MKQTKVVYPHKSVVNIYTVYKLDNFNNKNNLNIRKDSTNPDLTAQNCLFGAVNIIKDDENNSHYKYSDYGICFDGKSDFTYGNITSGRNVIILGVDVSFDSKSCVRSNDIYVLGHNSFIQGFNKDGIGHQINTIKLYKTNFTERGKKFVLLLHYNGDNSYLFVYG